MGVFNSASTKVFYSMFRIMQSALDENGVASEVDWIYHKDDDMSLEYAQEFKDDSETIKFNLISHG